MGARPEMVEVADAKNFHPRLTNLGTCDFGVALALPEIPATELIGVDERRNPKAHESLLERLRKILQRTDVSYLYVKFPYLTCTCVRFLKFALTCVLKNTDYRTGQARCNSRLSHQGKVVCAIVSL